MIGIILVISILFSIGNVGIRSRLFYDYGEHERAARSSSLNIPWKLSKQE